MLRLKKTGREDDLKNCTELVLRHFVFFADLMGVEDGFLSNFVRWIQLK